jgi:peptidyl-prolyl cis-trans isomerase D
MYDFVDRNKRIVQVLLALIMIPFAFVGVESYLRDKSADQVIAKIGSEKISRVEYDNALRDQSDRFRGMLGAQFDPAMFDNNEVRGQVLDGLVSQRLLKAQGADLKLTASTQQMQKVISEIPAFQEDGKFSGKRYEEVLRNQGMSTLMFEQRLRQDLSLQPLQESLSGAHFASTAQTKRWMELNEQQREVAVAQLSNQSFQAQINIDDATAKAHYEKNTSSYQSPEQVRLEYFVLSQSALAAQQTVDAAAVKAAYDIRGKEFAAPEERQASHILIATKADASSSDKDAAKKKATDILAKVTANPASFAELAKANSEDPGSKDQGGDLGFFGRGSMVKPFEEAVFAMKKDEVRGPIGSDFGFHIIKLTGVKGGAVPPLEEVKAKLEQDLKNQAAQQVFAKLATKFQDVVFEESENFKTIAEQAKIQPVSSQWLTRAQVQAIAMGSQKMTQAVFAKAASADKKNTESIEVAPNTMMAARVIEHKPAATRPFEDVKPEVVAELKRKGATDLAKTTGAQKLAQVQGGQEAGLQWGQAINTARGQRAPGVSEELGKQIFALPVDKLPAVVGAPSDQGGYTFARVTKVIDPAADEARVKASSTRVANLSGSDLSTAYIAALKSHRAVEIKRELIDKKDDASAKAPAVTADGKAEAPKPATAPAEKK